MKGIQTELRAEGSPLSLRAAALLDEAFHTIKAQRKTAAGEKKRADALDAALKAERRARG